MTVTQEITVEFESEATTYRITSDSDGLLTLSARMGGEYRYLHGLSLDLLKTALATIENLRS